MSIPMSEFFPKITIPDCVYESKALYYLGYVAFFVGVAKLTFFSLNFGSLLYDLYLRPATNYSKYGAKKGNWAVVTGASDGLGKEYAYQLAKKGFNIFLISRTLSKLEKISAEIEKEFKVETQIYSMDVSKDLESDYKNIKEIISTLPVTILINNVGQSHSIPVPFLETMDEELRNIITINNTATLKITQIVTPRILKTVETSPSRGLILTMGSFGGLLPTPYLATYSGSKAFLQSWSAALAGELAPSKIDVELVISYLVTSAMSKIKRSSLSIPNAKSFVRSTLSSVGHRGGARERYATVTPYPVHALMHFAIENTVGVYSHIANTLNYGMHKSIRTRALRKAERVAAAGKTTAGK